MIVEASEKVKVKDSYAGMDDRDRGSHLFYSRMTKIQALESSGKDIAWCRKEKIKNKEGEGTKISVTVIDIVIVSFLHKTKLKAS